MSLKIETGENDRYREGHGMISVRWLSIEEVCANASNPSLEVSIWEDGSIEFTTFTGWYRDPEDEPPLIFSKEDTPDVVMAVQGFLGSL